MTPPGDPAPIRGLCSMATRGLLDELSAAHAARSGVPVSFLAVGGVAAARRVLAGEPFDVVALATEAIDRLVAAGRADAPGRIDLARSGVGVAVGAASPLPDIASGAALREAVRAAARIGYSTGPSGVALMALFERWGLAEALRERLVRAPPGVPVAALVARGEVDLGFQQLGELTGVDGVRLVGPLPPDVQIQTVFAAAPATGGAASPAAVRDLLGFLASPAAADAKRRHGLAPA